jgi:hypothetical protein
MRTILFGAQAILEGNLISRSKKVEIEERLRRGETELRKVAALATCASRLIILQILAELIKSGWDSEVNHDHVSGLVQVVFHNHACRGDVVLRQACSVVGNINGERLARGLFIPRQAKRLSSNGLRGDEWRFPRSRLLASVVERPGNSTGSGSRCS